MADELVDGRPGASEVLDGGQQLLDQLVKLGRDVAETTEGAANVADLATRLRNAELHQCGPRRQRAKEDKGKTHKSAGQTLNERCELLK